MLWLNVTLLIGVGGFLATPDAPSVMFWALAMWALAEVVRSSDGRWWLLVGLFAGLGVISKLTDLFLGLGILAALLATRDLRRWLLSPWLWAGAIVALALATPMLLWNANHDWVTLTKQFGRIGSGSLQPLKFPEFIATQFGLLNPLVAIFLGLAATAWIGRDRKYPVAGIGLLLWTALPVIAYMAVHPFHQQIRGNWLARSIRRWRSPQPPRRKPRPRPGPVFAALPSPSGRRLSWSVSCWRLIRARCCPAISMPARRSAVGTRSPPRPMRYAGQTAREWIAGTNYSQVAELAYHLRDTATVAEINDRVRYSYAAPDATLLAKPVLILAKGKPDFLARCFATLTEVGTIERRSGDTIWDTFTAYRAEGAVAGAFDPGCDLLR